MAVNKGLKTLADNTPNFSNASTQALITAVVTADSTLNFASRVYYLIHKAEASAAITNAQRTDLNSSLDVQSHLNVGRYLYNLEQQTTNILNGSLGEVDAGADPGEDVPTFLEHLAAVQTFTSTIPSLYGVTADSLNKGVNGHFGTLSGAVDTYLVSLKEVVDRITSFTLSEDTAYQSAVQAVSDFIDTMDGSSVDDISTYNALLSAMETAAGNFNTALTAGYLAADRTSLINIRTAVNTQIALEQTNLGTIRTYAQTLTDTSSYVSFADDADFRNLLIRSSQNADWKGYFENYSTNIALDNPVYDTTQADSSTESVIDTVLRMRGLPDVTDYVDIDSVAKKATRDRRLAGQLTYAGTITGTISADIIKKACQLLNLTVDNRDVYAQSKSLLENMTQYDRDTVQSELNLYNDVNTLS
jgi:hypothetical protein